MLNEKSGDMAVIRIFSLGGNQVGGDRVKRYKSAPLFTMIPVGETARERRRRRPQS